MSVGDLLDVRVKDLIVSTYCICLEDPEVQARTPKVVIVEEWGCVYYSEATQRTLIQYLEGRKKGYLIMNNRKEKMAVRTAERVVDEYAKRARIQRIRGYITDKDGKRRALKVVTCSAVSEGGKYVEIIPPL
jgi:site-specific recombinase XerD